MMAMKFFSDRKFRYGSNSLLLTIIFIAILVMVNILVDSHVKWQLDLTQDKQFTLSQQTVEFLKGIEQEVKITCFYPLSQEPRDVKNLLHSYANNCSKLKIEFVDPDISPLVAKQYDIYSAGEGYGVIVFESGKRQKKIHEYELYGSGIEQKITGAINYVAGDKDLKVYFTEGHGEVPLSSLRIVNAALEDGGYTVERINLVTVEKVPEDADVIIVAGPRRDLSENEKAQLIEYLDGGGRAILQFDILNDLPNFNEVLNLYNMSLENTVIIERDSSMMIPNNPLYLLPQLQNTKVSADIAHNGLYVLMPQARSIRILNDNREDLTIETVARTSEMAWGETDTDSLKKGIGNIDDSDFAGPLDVAVCAVKKAANDTIGESRVLVFGNTSFITDEVLRGSGAAGNFDLFMNSVNWLSEHDGSIIISPKEITENRFTVSATQVWTILAGTLIVPVMIILLGIVVWLRRRHA